MKRKKTDHLTFMPLGVTHKGHNEGRGVIKMQTGGGVMTSVDVRI